MWAHVQYLCDKTEADVPKTFFENFKNLELVLFQHYNVFWSPEDGDTPSKVLAREHKILHVDDIKRANQRLSVPLAGYYKAIVLKLSDSEEELAKLLTKERIRKPTELTMEVKNAKLTTKRSSNTKKQEQAQKERARVANLRQLNISSSPEEDKNNRNDIKTDPLDHVSFSKYMEKDIENKAMEDELIALRSSSILQAEKIKILEDELREVTNQNKELVRLNIGFQLKAIDNKTTIKCKSKFIKRKLSFDSTDLNESYTIPKLNGQMDVKHVSNIEDKIEDLIENNFEDKIVDNVEDNNKEFGNPSTIENSSTELEDQRGFTLTNEQFKAVNQVPSGKAGDSRFIKNCIDILWSREQLCLRSATGTACPNMPNSEARPACSPEKKAYLQDLLDSRIKLEKQPINEEERIMRKKKIMEYLRSKIKTVRRDLKK